MSLLTYVHAMSVPKKRLTKVSQPDKLALRGDKMNVGLIVTVIVVILAIVGFFALV